MLQISYEVFGGAFALSLVGIWLINRMRSRRRMKSARASSAANSTEEQLGGDTEHRVLMYLMSQRTDTILAALANTIEQERQKLGAIVRKPSISHRIDPSLSAAASDCRPRTDQILAMTQRGVAIPSIARHLEMNEDEVAMVIRLDGAQAA